MNNKIQAGLELIAALNAEYLTSHDLRIILHTLITKDWGLVRDIIKAAINEKLLECREQTFRITREASWLKFRTPRITKRVEPGVCKRCDKPLTVCYYVDVGSMTYGPFGSMCIRKVRLV